MWKGRGDNKGLHLVAWDIVCTSKSNGGLGIRRLQLVSKSLLCKWLWRFGVEGDNRWRHVVLSRHGVQDNGDPSPVKGPYSSSPWKGIMRFFLEFKDELRMKIGNKQKTKFWVDKWCDVLMLMREFPLVFSLAADTQAFLSKYLEVRHGFVG